MLGYEERIVSGEWNERVNRIIIIIIIILQIYVIRQNALLKVICRMKHYLIP